MATTPPKLKPVAPPKPHSKTNVQCQSESKTPTASDVFPKSKDKLLPNDNNILPNPKTDNEGNILKFGVGKAVTAQSSGNSLPPKPALLPKPQTPTQKFPPKERPQIPRRPEPVASPPKKAAVAGGLLTRSATTLSLLTTRAPVAKLDEFDCLDRSQANPIRPPRSPKIKLFPDGPFKTNVVGIGDEKPELPVKKRSSSSSNIDKKKSLSLGRNENIMHLQTQQKSVSLVRNLSSRDEMSAHRSPPSPLAKPLPIPPPRRRKKSEDMASQMSGMTVSTECKDGHALPIYAQVNYEMKKNRRELISPVLLSNQPDELKDNNNEMEIIQGRLLLTKDNVETNCHPLADSEPISELLSVDDVGLPCPEGGYKLKTPDNLIFVDKKNYTDTGNDSLHGNEEAQAEEGCVDGEAKSCFPLPIKSQLYQLASQGQKLQACDHEKQTKADLSLVTVLTDSSGQSSENAVPKLGLTSVLTDNSTPVSPLPRTSELFRINSNMALKEIPCDNSPASYKNTGDCHTTTSICVCDKQSTNSILNTVAGSSKAFTGEELMTTNDFDKPRPASTATDTPEMILAPSIGETRSENCIDVVGSKTLSALYDKEKDPAGGASKLWRRQSWSSSKDTSPSPDRGSVRKPGQWCDEGDLSNGALADSDSSDNVARRADESESVHRNRNILTWLSFGKGSKRKERKQRETSSQFYSNEVKKTGRVSKLDISGPSVERSITCAGSISGLGDVTDGTRASTDAKLVPHLQVETCPDPDQCRVQADSVKRSPSGVSDILDNLGSSPAFDGERDSESENDEQVSNAICQLSPGQRKQKKVFYIAQELMTSERQFVDVLKLINIDFIEAVKKAGSKDNPVIPAGELPKIINSLPQLQGFNEQLLSDLETRIENWSSNPKISDIIVKKGPFLKLYSSYIKNFEIQCGYFDECCAKYPRFARAVKEFEESAVCKKLELKHFMLKPVQRIPQYRMLLEDYQRHLDPDSLDLADTEAALKIVRDVANHANHTLKLGDHSSKLIELQSQLINYEIIKPGRIYIKDGELCKLSRKVRHPRHFILLSDCLLYTLKLSVSQIRVNKELPLHGMHVSIPQTADDLYEFNIVSITRSFTLSASSQEERQEWVDALQNAIEEDANRKRTFQASKLAAQTVRQLGHQAPVWIQDVRVTMCQSCTTPFTVIFRRHHCRACGKVVCGVCSDNRAPLRYMGYQSDRVCGDCHDALLQEFEGPEAENIKRDLQAQESFRNMSVSDAFDATKALFKISGAGNKKKLLLKKDIPTRLKEVAANVSDSQMSGWLQRRGRRSWKRLWFVLKDQILYVYKASEDVVALESIPILGYNVEPMASRHFQIYEGIDAALVFQLAHMGQLPLVFHADSIQLANRWMKAMEAATILE